MSALSLIQSVTGGTKVKTFGSLDPARGDRRDLLSSREVSTFKGGVTAHVVGLDSSQLIEPAPRVESDQTSSTVSVTNLTGARREGAQVDVSQPSCWTLFPSWKISNMKLLVTRSAVLNLLISV